MKYIILIALFLGITPLVHAQKLVAKNGHIRFYSQTPLENIEANNGQVVSILDTETGSLQFMLLVKSFEFDRKLMQEHFNENYMESDTYPKSSFEGRIINADQIKFNVNGNYTARVSGKLTIHGVTKDVTTDGTISVEGKQVTARAKFNVKPEDYGIIIPDLVKEKIANEIEITVDVPYPVN